MSLEGRAFRLVQMAAFCLYWRRVRPPNAKQFEMLTTFKSLPSAPELPIIVAMKIGFRIGDEQHGGQSPQHHCSANPPLAWSPRGPVSDYPPPTQKPTDDFLRRGTACSARCSATDRRQSLATTRSIPAVASWLPFKPQPASPWSSPAPEKPVKTAQHSDISTRFWPKSRSCRKQTIKPCLPGSRIAQCASTELPSSIGQPPRRNR
jgi:hypothetical protein